MKRIMLFLVALLCVGQLSAKEVLKTKSMSCCRVTNDALKELIQTYIEEERCQCREYSKDWVIRLDIKKRENGDADVVICADEDAATFAMLLRYDYLWKGSELMFTRIKGHDIYIEYPAESSIEEFVTVRRSTHSVDYTVKVSDKNGMEVQDILFYDPFPTTIYYRYDAGTKTFIEKKRNRVEKYYK